MDLQPVQRLFVDLPQVAQAYFAILMVDAIEEVGGRKVEVCFGVTRAELVLGVKLCGLLWTM